MKSQQSKRWSYVSALLRVLRRQRRGAIAVIFALALLPMIGLIGLAVDFAIWNQAHAMLTRAANSAALNAVKVAGNAQIRAEPDFATKGQKAGTQWFNSQVANAAVPVSENSLTVTIDAGQSLKATVAYSGTIKSVFGAIFNQAQYTLNVSSVATIPTNPYLNVTLLLDNSSSMEIGATALPPPGKQYSDMETLLLNSPCDPSMVWYKDAQGNYQPAAPRVFPPAAQSYADYQCGNETLVGGIACPVKNTVTTQVFTPDPSSVAGPQLCPTSSFLQPNAYQGAPCAFACHFNTGGDDPNKWQDTFALARRLGVTLRFDVLKTATQQILTAMQNDSIASLNNLNVGIFAFNTDLTQVYPDPSLKEEAGHDWATASAYVGAPGGPPSAPGELYRPDTGIQPPVGAWVHNNNTFFSAIMTKLAAPPYLTAAGDGSSAATPRKVLMIITDGMEDDYKADGTDNRAPIDTTGCQAFKNMGYTVYVIYTTYFPIMHQYYFANLKNYVENTGPNTISGNLQACASSSDDYVEAADSSQLAADLQNFLVAALNAPARFTH